MTDGRQYEDIYEDADDVPYTPIMRLREFIERDRVDIAAVIWTACVLVILGSTIWTAAHVKVDQSGFFMAAQPTPTWLRIYALSTTAQYGPIVGIAIGLGIAAALDSAASRAAATLAMLGAIWIMIAGFLGIAYAVHHRGTQAPSMSGANTVAELAIAVLGVLLAAVAWRVATSVSDAELDDLDDDESDEAEPEMVS